MISVIIPCYNEEESIPLFYQTIIPVLTSMEEPFELLFVNDGSRDNTLKELRQLADSDSRVKYMSFSRNFGKESAM